MSLTPACTVACEARPECVVCHKPKFTRGRDPGIIAANSYCAHECEGYVLDPQPGHLWPGTLAKELALATALPCDCGARPTQGDGYSGMCEIDCSECCDGATDAPHYRVAYGNTWPEALANWDAMISEYLPASAVASC